MQQHLIQITDAADARAARPMHNDLLVSSARLAAIEDEAFAAAVRDQDRDEELMRMLGDMMLAEEWAEYHFLRCLPRNAGRVEISVLSHGAGSQTSALAAMASVNGFSTAAPGEPGYIDIDVAMFANVGDQGRPNEWPETIEYLWNLNRLAYLPIVRVDPFVWNPTLGRQDDARGLFDRYYDRETMPFRSFRGCTDMFKVAPQEAFLSWLIDEAAVVGVELHIRQIVGYSADEEDRAAKFTPSHANVHPYFPLIEWGWRRQDTVRRLRELAPLVVHVIGEPEKSGCWFCPFQAIGRYERDGRPSPRSWLALRDQHPDLLAQAQAMESRQNARRLREGKQAAFLAGTKPLPAKLKTLPDIPARQDALLDGLDGDPGDDTCTSWGCFR